MLADFLSGSIIDLQNTAAATDINSAFRKRRMITINALMRVTYDEDIIWMRISAYIVIEQAVVMEREQQ